MKIIPLYKFNRPDGGITISLIKPECEYTEMIRIIADSGMILTNGNETISCIDTDTVENWTEIVNDSYIPRKYTTNDKKEY